MFTADCSKNICGTEKGLVGQISKACENVWCLKSMVSLWILINRYTMENIPEFNVLINK